MSNVAQKIQTAGKDVLHVIEAPAKFIVKAEKVLATAIKDQPELKTTLTTLVQKGEAIVASGAKDYAEKGFNLSDDAATLALVQDFFAYFAQSVVPVIESVYSEVKVDLTSTAS